MTARYDLCFQAKIDEVLRTLPRSKYTYRDLEDNIVHVVKATETLFTIAAIYYTKVLKRPTMWYWVIADFQPTPIIDATIILEPGSRLVIPSVNTILNRILSADREAEFHKAAGADRCHLRISSAHSSYRKRTS